jgi:ATP-dependent protease HslVU (ClpYQ) peptidase subunit
VESDSDTPYVKALMLLAYKDTLYEICSSFVVIKYDNFQTLGEGCDWAIATLANTKSTDDVNERIIKALTISQKHCVKVGAPFLLIDTKNQEFKLVEGK